MQSQEASKELSLSLALTSPIHVALGIVPGQKEHGLWKGQSLWDN